jgi:hypothetical protein
LGFRRLPRWRLIGAAVVAAATIPASVSTISLANSWVRPYTYRATFIARGEQRALRYLADRRDQGGVLANTHIGLIVPATTGRHTYSGECLWSQPHCQARMTTSNDLFTGVYNSARARAFVRSTGARFVLKDCASSANLTRLLKPLVVSEKRFGCATVYEVRHP